MAAFRRSQEEIPEVLEKAWQRALESWSDTASHDEVMRLVTQHDAYAWAAAQYRRRPADAIRDRQLERVRKATEAPMLVAAFAKQRDKTKTPYKAPLVLLILMVLAAVAALLFTSILPKGGDDSVPPQPGSPTTPSRAR
jgi:hypothetical protein